MEKLSFRPMAWEDIHILQAMFHESGGFGANDLTALSRTPKDRFALVANAGSRIVGLVTANILGEEEKACLEIHTPFMMSYLYCQAEKDHEEQQSTTFHAGISDNNFDLSPVTRLTHEFKLAMISYARSRNPGLAKYRYAFSEGPIFDPIPPEQGDFQKTEDIIFPVQIVEPT
ncbi:MAG: hypothetical protein RBR86_06165 [Pseudobdellovibrionaceae bacterium]|nr:hypothetical protein [Pseudobdellovibrionaceae bacterium]